MVWVPVCLGESEFAQSKEWCKSQMLAEFFDILQDLSIDHANVTKRLTEARKVVKAKMGRGCSFYFILLPVPAQRTVVGKGLRTNHV
jgi:hypothetical protein